jgi:16S rRNA A1518/A1519 N6-dimethyltransferase RsmA/KsgA/DIM1 with predicted DNA glycosylase/AP lyase activity
MVPGLAHGYTCQRFLRLRLSGGRFLSERSQNNKAENKQAKFFQQLVHLLFFRRRKVLFCFYNSYFKRQKLFVNNFLEKKNLEGLI